MKVHELIVEFLLAEDVNTVYSLMSEDIMGITSTIREDTDVEIEVVECRHEQGAIAMADGHNRATGDLGVAVVGRGPAIGQAGTGLATARNRGSSVLVITSDSPQSTTRDVKNFDQRAFLKATCAGVESVRDPEALVPTFVDVFRRLRYEDGPIAVQIPWDVIDGEAKGVDSWESSGIGSERTTGDRTRVEPDHDAVDKMVEMYLDSDATIPPVIVTGEGAIEANAADAIQMLAERTNAMLATTLQAQGCFADHPYGVGFVGTFGTTLANQILSEADFVLAVGCSLNEHTTDQGRLLDESTVVHIDSNPVKIGAETQVDLGIVGDARTTVEAINQKLEEADIDFSGKFWTDSWKRRIADSSPFDEREFDVQPDRIDPRDLIRTLDPLLPENRLVVTDGGHFINWVLDGITIPTAGDYIWTIDFGAIGIGVPIGFGAANAETDRQTVLFTGDAGFMMSQPEMDTAVRQEIPIIIVAMNDDALGSEYQQLAGRDMYTEAAVVESPDFADLANGFGAEGHTIRAVEDIETIEERLRNPPNHPIVLDCKVDRDVRHRFYDTVHEF